MRFKLYRVTLLCAAILVSVSGNSQTPEYARQGMVVSASVIASETGRDILRDGGNAIDAAVATAFALAVTWPSAGNIGGGGFLLYLPHNGEATSFDFREKAPQGASPTMYLDAEGNLVPNLNHESILAVGVPGTVAGLYQAHRKFGKLPWKKVVAPAVRLARKGFPFTYALHQHSKNLEKKWKAYPSTASVMYKNGTDFYQPGEQWKQPELAATLNRIKRKGHDGFYRGKTAELLAAFMRAEGGLITEADLAAYQASERKPLTGTYRDFEVISMPPPSSGGITLLQMLNILEGYDLKALGYQSADYIHLLSEAMRRGYANRAMHLGDPDFNPNIPIDRLISKEYAATLRSTIQMDTVSPSDSSAFTQPYESPSTTHLSVMDKDGNAVSLTYTLEYSYGSQIVAKGLGFFLNNEMGDFNPVPGKTTTKGQIGTAPNLIAPGKRMLSSMTPTILTRKGAPALIIGSPGGRTIINTVLQVIVNYADHGMNVAEAINACRFHHQWLPDILSTEDRCISPDTQRLLEEKGHRLRVIPYKQGAAMGISYDPDTKIFSGHADPRAPDGGLAGF